MTRMRWRIVHLRVLHGRPYRRQARRWRELLLKRLLCAILLSLELGQANGQAIGPRRGLLQPGVTVLGVVLRELRLLLQERECGVCVFSVVRMCSSWLM